MPVWSSRIILRYVSCGCVLRPAVAPACAGNGSGRVSPADYGRVRNYLWSVRRGVACISMPSLSCRSCAPGHIWCNGRSPPLWRSLQVRVCSLPASSLLRYFPWPHGLHPKPIAILSVLSKISLSTGTCESPTLCPFRWRLPLSPSCGHRARSRAQRLPDTHSYIRIFDFEKMVQSFRDNNFVMKTKYFRYEGLDSQSFI